MSKKLFFLISFVLLVGLNGTARADAIDVNNHSFEYDINGVQITELTGWDAVQGWIMRDNTGWAAGWQFVDAKWDWAEGYEAADGNVCSFNVTADEPEDANISCQMYQILEDPNAVIAENRRYTLTFNALRLGTEDTPTAYGALFYSVGGVNVAPANDVILADKETLLTSLPWGQAGYAGWEEITLNYTALSGAGSIGETLGVKLSVPADDPWLNGYQVVLDNVRVDWLWATDAWDPNPQDGAELVTKNPTLDWKPGVWVASTAGHEVYFGTDETAVANADNTDTTGIYQDVCDVNNFTPAGPLVLGETYYWKITEVNSAYGGTEPPPGPWEGDVWSFRVEGHAHGPGPADGETDVPFLNHSLVWTAGTDATSHDVYLGTDANDVADANTNSPQFMVNQVLGDTDYALTGLAVYETYYWRIDERSAVHPSGLKGDVWSFTVGLFLIVDDFDSYNNNTALWSVWDDWFVNGSDGSIWRENDVNWIRESGSQAAKLQFENVSHGGSGIYGSWFDVQDMTELDIGSDWTVGGVEALFLYMRGDPCNAQVVYSDGKGNIEWEGAAPWIELEDTSSNTGYVVHPNPSLMGSDSWNEWNVDLNIFDACGVNLTAIDRFTIGVGGDTKAGQSKAMSGAGYIYVDDIRLYPPRCRTDTQGAAYFNSKGDFTGPDGMIDCTVDEFDLDVMGAQWLFSDFNAAAAPPASPPEVWYRFDDGSGSTVLENSGSWGTQYDITIGNPPASDEPAWTSDTASALDPCDPNYALDFDGTDDYLEIPNSPATNFAGTENMTITVWMKGTATDWSNLVCSATADPRHATGLGIHPASKLMYYWNESYWSWASGLTVPDGQWTFMAVAVEPTKATAYVSDGTTLNAATNVAAHGPLEDFDTDCFNVLGQDAKDAGWVDGILDDVRFYNKTLTTGEIVALAGIAEVYMPNTSVANIAPKTPAPTNYDPNDPDIVNFNDYDIMARNWLAQFLWP